MEPAVIIFIAVILGGALIAWHFHASSARRKELAAYAAERGLSFLPDKVRSMDDRYPEFKCFRRGHSRYAHNVLSGEMQGLPVHAFDYHYATGSGKNRRVHRFSAVIVTSPVPLKPLLVRRENVFDKVTEFFGVDDIDFESAEFSRKFFVKSPDKRWAYDVIHPRMMEYLLQAPQYSIQFDTGNVLAWRSRRFDPAQFDEAFHHVREMLERLPDYLFRK